MKARLIFHALAIVVLTAMVAFAQEPPKQPKQSAQQQASAAADGNAAARTTDASTRRTESEAAEKLRATPAGSEQNSSGQAASPKVTPHQPSMNARNSAHASESLSAPDPATDGKLPSSTVYQESKMGGTNPLFESKDTMQKKPSGGGSSGAAPQGGTPPKLQPQKNGGTGK